MIRGLVLFVGLLVASALVWFGFRAGDGPRGDLLLNLASETFGILVTVALVEWLFERRRRQDRARDHAWRTFHALERGVWVWRGGPRRMEMEQLLGLIGSVRPDDQLAQVTRTLFTALGAQSRETMDREPVVVSSLPGLARALEELSSLRGLAEGDHVTVRVIAEVLDSSAVALARVLGQPVGRIPSALIPYQDASTDGQAERHEAA